MVNICDERPKNELLKFTRVELYLLFSTDGDFHVNLDGLETFIRGHLGENVRKFDFRAEVVSTPEWNLDEHQFVRLSINLPWELCRINDESRSSDGVYYRSWSSGCVYYRRLNWADEAIEQVMLPAYMWIFAEIGVGNGHGLSTYFDTKPFDLMWERAGGTPTWKMSKSDFTNGVKTIRIPFMRGNYRDGWVEWRFVIQGASNFGGSREYIETVRKELEEQNND